MTITPATQAKQSPNMVTVVTENTPPKELINSLQQKIRDSLSIEGNQLSALHDTSSKVALPGPKSSKLPARKKNICVSNTGEVSEANVDEDEED